MTQQQEVGFLERKLNLWNTPGFQAFLQDLVDAKGVECDLNLIIDSIRKQYLIRLKELAPKSRYIQKELF